MGIIVSTVALISGVSLGAVISAMPDAVCVLFSKYSWVVELGSPCTGATASNVTNSLYVLVSPDGEVMFIVIGITYVDAGRVEFT